MWADAEGINRENLVQEISNVLCQWPERERKIFTEVHYHGQSLEAVSRSFGMGAKEVSAILRKCERKLQTALRDF